MNFFNLTLSGKHFICPSILNDSFAGQSHLGCRSLPFMTWNTSFQHLLACQVSFEKSPESLMVTPLQVTVFFLAAFKILSLSLILGNLIMLCLGVCLLESNFFGTLLVSWICMSSSYTRLGKSSFIICSNKFSMSCSFSSPSGTTMIWMLERLKLSQSCLSSFSQILVSSFCSG